MQKNNGAIISNFFGAIFSILHFSYHSFREFVATVLFLMHQSGYKTAASTANL